jgi:hypothetical protein
LREEIGQGISGEDGGLREAAARCCH